MSSRSGEIGLHDPVMAWSPCVPCSRLVSRGSKVDVVKFCEQCQEKRQNYLAPRLRDRSYRAHLARRALGINACDAQSSCPEQPHGHSIMNISNTAENSQIDITDTYEILITAMSDKLMRRDRWSVSTLEVIISHRDVHHRVKYCATCFQNAYQQSRSLPNAQIRLCNACLFRRDEHISRVHIRQHSFHEVWENDLTRMPVCWQEHDPVQYSYDFDRAIVRISGREWGLKGGSEWVDVASKISLVAIGAFHAGITCWNTVINNRNSLTARETLEETKRKNAVDETIAVQNAETNRLNALTAREALEETKRKNAFDEVSAMQIHRSRDRED